MAAAKRLDADYQEAWGEYEDAMLRENHDAVYPCKYSTYTKTELVTGFRP